MGSDFVQQTPPKTISCFALRFTLNKAINLLWWCLLDDVRTFFEQNPENFADWPAQFTPWQHGVFAIRGISARRPLRFRWAKQKNFLNISLIARPQKFFQLRKRKFFCFDILLTQNCGNASHPIARAGREGKVRGKGIPAPALASAAAE